jgi:hypothetical protein
MNEEEQDPAETWVLTTPKGDDVGLKLIERPRGDIHLREETIDGTIHNDIYIGTSERRPLAELLLKGLPTPEKRPCPFIFAWGDPNSKICKVLASNFIQGADMSCIGEENCPIYNGGIEKCNGK